MNILCYNRLYILSKARVRTRGIMSEKPENNVYMPSEIIENEQGEQALEEKFVTDPQKGLGQKDVENRIAEGKVNGDTNIKTKSVAQILRENIVTFFNFVFIALALLIFFLWTQAKVWFRFSATSALCCSSFQCARRHIPRDESKAYD